MSALKKLLAPSVRLKLEAEAADDSATILDWRIRINYNVLADAQKVCGHNFIGGGGILEWADDPARIRALLWAALLPEQPELREEEPAGVKNWIPANLLIIGEYLNGANRGDVLEALFKAYSLYLSKDKRQEFDKACVDILSVVRTGKLPKEMETASRPLAQSASGESSSPGKDSEPSPESDSESLTTTSSAA